MVRQARGFDPNFTRADKADREKAVALYEQAIALHPGAKINPALANRIAQLYAFYENKAKGVQPDRPKAIAWWRTCAQMAGPRQPIAAEARMGIGCSSVISGQPHAAAAAFQAILALDPEKAELPDWRIFPPDQIEQEKAKLRQSSQDVRIKAIDMVHYALVRFHAREGVEALRDIAIACQGTPAGQRAWTLALKLAEKSKISLLPPTAPTPAAEAASPPMTQTASGKGPAGTQSDVGRTAGAATHSAVGRTSAAATEEAAVSERRPTVGRTAGAAQEQSDPLPPGPRTPWLSRAAPWAFGAAGLTTLVALACFLWKRRIP